MEAFPKSIGKAIQKKQFVVLVHEILQGMKVDASL